MSEKLQPNGEHSNAERLAENSGELHEKLQERREKELSHENDAERSAEKARQDIERIEKQNEKEDKVAELSPAEKRKAHMPSRNNFSPDLSFKKTMTSIQSKMPVLSRAFSKFIHVKPIEKASEVAGNTVARPNALLSGAIFAFLFTIVIYLWAKNAGYPLSGFETIGAFIIGYLVGIIVDFVRIMITGKQ